MDTVLSFIDENRSLPDLKQLPVTMSTLLLTPRFKASRHVIYLVFEAGSTQPALVAKIPRMPELRESLDHEAGVLQSIQRLSPGGFRSIPRVMAYQDHHGYPILLETAINGQLMSPDVVRRDPERMIRITRDWLLDIQSRPTRPHDDRWYYHLVESKIIALRESLPLTGEEDELLQQCEQYLSVLKGASLPYVLAHGDLGHPNLVLTGHDSIGVIDWELAGIEGLVAGDFFFFLSYVAFSRDSSNESGDYICSFEKAFFVDQAWAQPHVRSFITALGIRPNAVPALFLLSWLQYLLQFIERLRIHKTYSMSPETADIVRKNRYYAIWKYTVERFGALALC